ncbi:putative leucine-rich repeat-containing protein DDB_G0290503 isoform X2 [Linepithema humile]|uniref:putative leucine-rich repeat-containing protein DDB_G0290503 isoform X2 n=1 Tax=Linepithema humile TaxID=83485 RepID=UPI0006231DC3|nr:PREDICTED: hyaluronan mediated motility receptor-like isoform X2 [Linepithema humile]
MSFSKAKIQRFNELGSEAPPPGAYDPKFDNKVKGLVIEKSDRFLDTKSLCSSECNASVASAKSNGTTMSTPLFRTPQTSRKQLVTKLNCPKSKNDHTSLVRSQNMKYESNQQLADLRVECLNKNKTIQEHEKHIEEMKDNVQKLEAELEELHTKQAAIEEQHKKEMEKMAETQQAIINDHDDKNQEHLQILRSELLEMCKEKEQEISLRKVVEAELKNRTFELSRKISILEDELSAIKEENKIKIETLETHIEELLNSLKTVERDRDTEIGLLQKEKCQLELCITDLTQERSNLEAKSEKKQNIILELQAQLSALQCELDELKTEYEKLADDSIKRISDLTDKHEKKIEHLKDVFLKEKKELVMENETYKARESEAKTKVNEMERRNSFLLQELKDFHIRYRDMSQCLQEIREQLEISNKNHTITVQNYEKDLKEALNTHAEEKLKLEQLLEDTKEEYLKELENITIMKDKELDEFKQTSAKKVEEETKRVAERAQKMIDNAEAATRETLAACRAESEERVKKVMVECDTKVNTMIKDAQSTVKDEMRLAIKRYKACLAHMEAERTALDQKLSQKDAEITKLSATLEELRLSAETQESFSQSLQIELDKAETELAEKKEELRGLKDYIRAEAAEMVARKKRFEVIMAENQASVVALTNRLAQSNAEVERLQHELKRDEDCIREHRDLLSVMRNNSQMVHEQVHVLIEELNAHRELVEQLETGNLSEFESIKSILETKIENLKQKAAKEIAGLQNDSEEKSLQNNKLKKQLDEMSASLNDAQDLLLKLEERNDVQAIDISRMELTNNKLLEQLRNQEKALKESNQLLQVQATQHKTAIDEANSRLEELSEKVKLFKEKKKYTEENALSLEQEQIKRKTLENTLTQKLQEERMRREEVEEEVKRITELNNRLKKDYEEISEKYVDVIGHQNPKQRIKHVTQLKEKIIQQEQELHTKTRLIEQQQKTIEKFKAEEKRSYWKGKENVGIVHSTPISSPHKTLTPLRSRND